MVASPVTVGIAEIQAINGAAMLTSLGLGSCVSVCVLDPQANVSGMVQVMLPRSIPLDGEEKPGTFADVGIPELIKSMVQLGANKNDMVAAVVGGATFRCVSPELELGRRTAEAVVDQLKRFGIRCVAHDLGNCIRRTVTMTTESGKVVVNTVRGEDILCNLRGV